MGSRNAIMRLDSLFKQICSKTILTKPDNKRAFMTFVAETICLLEIWFLPSFWDITTHLIIHLVEEVILCGPVTIRWCYPIERYITVLVSYVRDKL